MIRLQHVVLLSLGLLQSLAVAYDTYEKYTDIYKTPLYNTLTSCAQKCIDGVDTHLKCWSYGCVCSENTPGTNFINATRYIESCVQSSCAQSSDTTRNSALDAFQSFCNVTYYTNLNATATGSLSVAPTISVTVTVGSPSATATFNRK